MLSWQIFLVPGKVGDTWHYLSDCEDCNTVCDSVYRQPSSNVKHLPNGCDRSHLPLSLLGKGRCLSAGLGWPEGPCGDVRICASCAEGPELLRFDASTKGKGLKWGMLNLEHCGQGQQMSQRSRGSSWLNTIKHKFHKFLFLNCLCIMLVCNFLEVQMLLTLKTKLHTSWRKGKGDSSASS